MIGSICRFPDLLASTIQRYQEFKRTCTSTSYIKQLLKSGLKQLQTQISIMVITLMISHSERPKAFCPICLSQIEQSVISEQCKHAYCCSCIHEYWLHNQRHALKCPYCRQKIQSFMINFKIQSENIKYCIQFIMRYNFLYGNYTILQPFKTIRNVYQVVRQLFKQIYDLAKLVTNLSLMLILTLLTLYVVSPIDLLPELYLGLFGIIDDIVCVFFILWIVCTLTIIR